MSITSIQGSDLSAPDVRTTQPVMEKQEFLMLLVAQLKNQDPLKPTEDREFIAQLAQFSALEQMQDINKTLGSLAEMTVLGQVAGFIGKHVVALDPNGGDLVSGVVAEVSIVDGGVQLTVGGSRIDVRDVVSISEAPSTTETATETKTSEETTEEEATVDAQ